jgi:SAM-dependent methyltransferase
MREAQVRTVLELGCGTGNDAARLARAGYAVTAVDVSGEAIAHARSRFGEAVDFRVCDITLPLPYPDASFDAVMSNVALHMFSDSVTRAVFAQIARVVRPGGLFLFHVNALEDRELRARRRPIARELKPDYVLERSGQTMHFFSEAYLRDLLSGWRETRLDWIEIRDRRTAKPFKRVWCGIARR